ncbi:MAG: 4Fe-4S binding protein [Desulfovibrio sp.]|jgi:ferredoxin|nr:4Fe-4S binding protein [Desulfovibrio sp.]
MLRKIIEINEDLCIGCGLCVDACHEGAIGLVDGKARLSRDDYCDGLGNCLPACPSGAIRLMEREPTAYNSSAVTQRVTEERKENPQPVCACPGMSSREIARPFHTVSAQISQSQLRQWPIQIRLVPVTAPYFANAHLLIAADCAAYAYANFHEDFMRDKISLIGCPKLDDGDYSDKLSAIIASNTIAGIVVVRMEVPCCAGISGAALAALEKSGKELPMQVYTLSVNGRILKA